MRIIKTSIAIGILILQGCATPQSIAEKEFTEWHATVGTHVESGQMKKSDYYLKIEEIGKKNNASNLIEMGFFYKEKAIQMERGQLSKEQFANLELRNQTEPQALRDEAHYYYAIKKRYEPLCNSFGYASGLPDFNKCVYDISQKELSMVLQQPRTVIIQQPPAPVPVQRPPRNTNCTAVGNTINCTSY